MASSRPAGTANGSPAATERPTSDTRREDPGSDGVRRLRLLEASAGREPGSRVRIRVALGREEEVFSAEADGVGTETVELRLTAETALRALHAAIGVERFRLLGVKRLHAFDADVILVVLRDRDSATRRCVGAVAVRHDRVDGAARAVLDATNRLIARMGTGEDG